MEGQAVAVAAWARRAVVVDEPESFEFFRQRPPLVADRFDLVGRQPSARRIAIPYCTRSCSCFI
jgi:hypothetical protein